MAQDSVIIPVYSAEIHLEKCVENVMAKTLRGIEIICVDDGSSDNSLEILKKLLAKDKRIRIVLPPNGGRCGQLAGHDRTQGLLQKPAVQFQFLCKEQGESILHEHGVQSYPGSADA